MAEALPLTNAELAQAQLVLLDRFGALMVAFGEAQEAGLDAGAILVQALSETLAEQGQELPPMLRMLF